MPPRMRTLLWTPALASSSPMESAGAWRPPALSPGASLLGLHGVARSGPAAWLNAAWRCPRARVGVRSALQETGASVVFVRDGTQVTALARRRGAAPFLEGPVILLLSRVEVVVRGKL